VWDAVTAGSSSHSTLFCKSTLYSYRGGKTRPAKELQDETFPALSEKLNHHNDSFLILQIIAAPRVTVTKASTFRKTEEPKSLDY